MNVSRAPRWEDMDKSGIELSILMSNFEIHNRTEQKSSKTVEWYNEVLGLFHGWLREQGHSTTLEAMDENLVRLFILELQQRPGTKGRKMSTHTVANRVRALRAFFAWLKRKGYTKHHLLEDLRVPRTEELIVEPLSNDEIGKVFSAMNPNSALGARNTALISLMLDTGMRVSEEANLKDVDVNRDSRYVKVMGKGSKERMISFGVACEKALFQYYHYFRGVPVHPGVETFFLSVDGYSLTTSAVQSIVKRIARTSGVQRLHPHLLRHTYATLYLLNGGDVFTLQQNLGHTSLEMVSRYVHLASRVAAVRSQGFSPLDRLNGAQNRRFRHGFTQGGAMAGSIYPNVGMSRKPRARVRN